MPQLYAITYLCPTPESRRSPVHPVKSVATFYSAVRTSRFPYDIGDDPAFFSARYLDGPVTWGICRPDVRNQIDPGDWVNFFAAVNSGTEKIDYQFVAALCVAKKISHTAIFMTEQNRLFQDYLNLLIRPVSNGWEHHEPALHHREWHKDWLWRVARQSGRHKKDLEETRNQLISHKTANEVLASVPENYVVFEPRTAIMPSDPIGVATYRRTDEPNGREIWSADSRAQRIRDEIFCHETRGLRTANRQQPHRHFRRTLTDDLWPERLREITCSR